jgi:hypothetical protein
MPKVSTESVEPPDDQDIKLAPLSGCQHLIKRGSSVFRSRDATVNVFNGSPAPAFAIRPEFVKLILNVLVGC